MKADIKYLRATATDSIGLEVCLQSAMPGFVLKSLTVIASCSFPVIFQMNIHTESDGHKKTASSYPLLCRCKNRPQFPCIIFIFKVYGCRRILKLKRNTLSLFQVAEKQLKYLKMLYSLSTVLRFVESHKN